MIFIQKDAFFTAKNELFDATGEEVRIKTFEKCHDADLQVFILINIFSGFKNVDKLFYFKLNHPINGPHFANVQFLTHFTNIVCAVNFSVQVVIIMHGPEIV